MEGMTRRKEGVHTLRPVETECTARHPGPRGEAPWLNRRHKMWARAFFAQDEEARRGKQFRTGWVG